MDFHVKVDEGMQELYGIKAAWALASVYTETAKMGQVRAERAMQYTIPTRRALTWPSLS